MGYEHDMEEYRDELIRAETHRPYLKFHDNKINCKNVGMLTIMWEYFCWVMAGKPQINDNILD